MKTQRPSESARVTSLIPPFAAMAVAGAIVLSACSKPPPPPPPPAPKKVEAPPPPEPVRIDPLLQSMKADARVQFPQTSAPTDEQIARAVIGFADALARGDSDKFKTMLDPVGKGVLDKLVSTGQWDESTGKAVDAVRVAKLLQTGDSAAIVTIAIQDARGAYPLQWAAAKAAGAVIFVAMPTENMVRARASEFDTLDVTPSVGGASASADAPASGSNDSKPAGDAPAKDDDKPPADGATPDKIRRTPNGPVTIPGTGKPGGQ